MDRHLSAQQRRARWRPVVGKVLVGAALIALVGWSGQRYLRPSLERSSLRIAAVERGPLEATVAATGTVVPRVEQTISSPVNAEIRTVAVSLGERVGRDQLIMQLDTTGSALALSSLEDELALTRADLRTRELELADRIRQARSRRDLLAIDLESREVRFDRFEQLAGTGVLSEDELLEAELDVKRTRIELDQADAEILSLEAQREAALERLEVEASILKSRRADQARRLAMSSVKAPIDGIITNLVQEAGSAVTEGQALAIIVADGEFGVEATLSDYYARELGPGQRVRVRSSSGEVGGALARVVPDAREPRLALFIELDEPDAAHLRASLHVDIDVITAHRADVLQVRRGPGVEGAGIQQLYVIDGERAVRTPVRLGASARQSIEIVDGLSVGDRIVISDMSAYEHLSEIRIH